MPAGTIYELSVDMDLGGNKVMNVHHFEQTSGDLGQDPRAELIDAYQGDVQTFQLACQSADISITGYRCRAVSPTPTQSFVNTDAAAGTLVGEALPANASAVVAWYTEEGSPVRVGRTFLPGIREEDTLQGLVTNVLRVLLIAFGNVIVDSIESGNTLTFTKVLYKTLDETFLNVLTGEPRPRVMGLRSRTKGVGQ